ncbi:MAG: carboxypeptidase-like regulatory domain-containing protein, partial [Bacteroidota bacterium]
MLLLAWSWIPVAGLGAVWTAHAQDYSVEPPRFIFDSVDKGYDLVFRPDHIVRIQWPADYNLSNAALRWARSPAALAASARSASAQGNEAFIDVTPAALDMAVGQWYGQVFADQGVSNVFFIYVESETPPTATVRNPESEVPTFEVTPVPGVPAYGIGVSDTPFTVKLDPDGDLAVEGLTLIWNYVGTTGETSIPYAKDAINPVPLERGRTYYYIVFNAYEPSDVRFLSSVNAGVFTFKNGIDPSRIEAPTLGSPAPEATLSDETVRFTWDAVDNGDRYKVTVLQEYELLGNVGEIEVWSTTVIGNGEGGQQLAVDFDARRVLTRDTYRWFVSVESLALGESKASERRTFDYRRPVANLALVIQQVGGQPLSGVQVDVASNDFVPRDGQLDLQNATSGTFELPLGTYTLTLSKEGHRTTTRTVTLSTADAAVTEVVQLPALTTTVQGTVSDDNGQPIFGALVEAASGDATDRTDAGGLYQLFLEAGGTVTLRASATGFAAATRTIDAADAGTTTGIDFTLMPDRATVSGRVTTSEGRSLALASLTATHSDGREVTTRTDGNGSYTLTLSSGQWQLVAELQGFQQTQTALTLGLGQDLTQDFQLEAAQQEVVLEVVNAQGPLVEATVTTRVEGRTITQRTDAQGQARFSIPAGRYAFHVTAGAHAPATVYAALLPTMTTLILRMALQEHSLNVQGQVQDARGNVPNAIVEAYRCTQPRPTPADAPVDLRVGDAPFTCLGSVTLINQTTTDEAGIYRLALPPLVGGEATPYLLRAHHASDGRGTALDVVFPVDDRPLTLNLTLPLGAGRLTGRVRARSGRDVRAEQLAVTLRPTEGNGQYAAYPDRDGLFTITAPYDTYTLQAFDRSGRYSVAAPETVQLQPGQVTAAPTLEVVEVDRLWSGTVNVPDAAIVLQQGEASYATVAAANGAFGIRVPAGTYHARIRGEGWLPLRQSVTVAEAEQAAAAPTSTSITLQRAGTSVRGQVRTTEGLPLDGARVAVVANGVPADTVFTDAQGRYVVDATEGFVRLIAERPGYAPAEQQLLLALGQPLSGIDMVLQPRLATLTGSIRDDANVPLQGSRLVVLSRESGGRTLSSSGGEVTLSQLVPGRYSIGITRRGYETVTLQDIPLQQGFNPITARQMRQQASLQGTVRTDDAVPIPDASVTVGYADGATFTALTGTDGTFRF